MWWLFQLASLAAIPLAARMACDRSRSARAWAWIAVLIGPLAPLVLVILGETKHPVPAL